MLSFGSYERIILCGHLGKDAETKFTQGGKSVTSFSVAVSKYNGKDKQNTTEWREVVSFDETIGKQVARLTKGTQVLLQGSLSTNVWQDREGKDRFSVKIMALDIAILGGKPKGSDEGDSGSHPPEPKSSATPDNGSAPAQSQSSNTIDDDDIPF